MEYLWIIMLGIAYIIWSISSIKNLIRAWRFPVYDIDDYACAWVVSTILALFLWSFMLWL